MSYTSRWVVIRLRSIGLLAFLPSLAVGALALALLTVPTLASAAGPPARRPSRPVCPGPAAGGVADCHARVVTDRGGAPLATSGPTGYGPAQFHGAYELPTEAASAQTIAIVDAYDDPTIEEDLAVYSETYGLPACTTANGCFRKVNQNGQEGSYPNADSGWALEISLDVEVAHAICQNCRILLVEASSNSFANLGAAVNTAASLGADEISNSYGGGEFGAEASDPSYDHPGIVITASAGDSGYGAEYPAASPYVVAVGGTTLTLGPSDSYGEETVWSGSGSGCSAYEPAQAWQTADPNWAATGCGAKREVADVAADAAPETGAALYDTTRYKGQEGWFKVGGTSLSAPLIAAVYALAGGASSEYPAADPYAHQADSPAGLHDVTSGSNGTCGGTIMCEAAAGYDGPTGVGTPRGLVAFGAPTPHTLTLTKQGPAENIAHSWVSSEDGGQTLNCGSFCTVRAAESEGEVTLHAYGPSFAGWSGDCAGAGRECTVDLGTEDRAVTARFTERRLSFEKEGATAETRVLSDDPGHALNCASSCTARTVYLPEGATVTLQAFGYAFAGWGAGDCEAAGASRECTLTMSAARDVLARFTKSELTLVKDNPLNHNSWVTSDDPEHLINCGPSCTERTAYFEASTATLHAYGSSFSGWTGCDALAGARDRECTVEFASPGEARTVEAGF